MKMYCRKCGSYIDDNAYYCPVCGTSVKSGGVASDDAKSLGWGVLSFFFPIIGIILFAIWHKEYPLRSKSCIRGVLVGVILYVVGIVISVVSAFSLAAFLGSMALIL